MNNSLFKEIILKTIPGLLLGCGVIEKSCPTKTPPTFRKKFSLPALQRRLANPANYNSSSNYLTARTLLRRAGKQLRLY